MVLNRNSILNLFYRLPQNFLKVFWGKNFLWHILAFGLTVALIITGFDWKYYVYFQNSKYSSLLFPAVVLGFFVPVFLPLAVLLAGLLKKNFRSVNSAYALTQAAFLGWLTSAFYKALTGRPGPPHFLAGRMEDISRVFNFGFLRGGVFWGWPSSHTTVAVAISVCAIMLYPKNRAIGVSAILYGLYVGFGVSTNIHWFSDFVAGVIFGSLVGISVGKSFYERFISLKN